VTVQQRERKNPASPKPPKKADGVGVNQVILVFVVSQLGKLTTLLVDDSGLVTDDAFQMLYAW